MSESSRYKQYEPLFGSWYIKKKIGQGAIGQVYEIERDELDTTYSAALKVITIPERQEDIKRVISSGVAQEDLVDYYRNLVRNIANEFKFLARLKGNSYIVNYEDHQIIENVDELKWDVLIKTELLTPLIEHVIEHPMREADVLRLGIDICRALSFCAKYNILHRDIKPENIFIAPSGNYKLGDFGIARVIEETYMNFSRKGTYTYMAPEVFHGRRYAQSADLYSLGIVMYKYLNHGRIPFLPDYPEKISFDDPEKAFAKRMSGEALPEPAEGSARLRKIVLKSCAFKPEDRYSCADDMLVELEELWLTQNKRKSGSKRKNRVSSSSAEARKRTEPSDNGSAAKEKAAEAVEPEKDRKEKSIWKIAAVVIAVLALTAGGIYAAIPKEVTDITGIDPEVQLYYDGSLEPEYKIEPDWFRNEKIEFISSDEDIFKVSDEGRIIPASVGEADLELSAKEYKETVHVKVVPKVTDITGVEKTYSLYPDDTVSLKPKLEPAEFADEPVTYSTSDKKLATVDGAGKVTAVSKGEAKITVSAGGSSIITTITIREPVVQDTAAYSKSSVGTSKKKSSKKKTTNKKSGSSKESFGDEEYF